MASYDYSCKNCKTNYTIIRGLTEAEDTYYCEECSHELNRVYTWGSTTFNGKGFYSTDKGDK